MQAALTEMKSANAQRHGVDDSGLKSGDGGGTFEGMEARVAKLEADMDHVKRSLDRLADVPADLATLKERTSHLPTKDYIDRRLLAMLALIAALTVFADKLQTLVN